ncbi:hypothetical protein BGZ61DRAFT_485569 [Ilyonectria robusta]|uniref:uncharacterized protein n=1 Tax=Ilyonectria robusta TaxID=1079257 RepID=UPI001E8EB374|nr:uncharacterized protein BGZ61DRAFT_485569 [Ilyonectria robusta]KAH8661017.1 hypothetical protein BGZ61DRAFT_485569 [Ilyonectria robusta]
MSGPTSCGAVFGIGATLKKLATETETTAEQFRRDKSSLDDEGRYYRFNVARGLEDVGLEESKKQREIAAATGRHVTLQDVVRQMKACANGLARKQYFGSYKTPFSLEGVLVSSHFVDRPSDTADLEKYLLPRRSHSRQTRKVFVLHGLGGIGKTQLAIDFARRHQATFSSVFWLDGSMSRNQAEAHSKGDLDAAVASVMEWLARPDNRDWLLIFDNVDQDHEQGGVTGAYDLRRYLPGDHGAILVTTRLSRLAQLGESRRLAKVDLSLSRAIFERWYGSELQNVFCKSGTEQSLAEEWDTHRRSLEAILLELGQPQNPKNCGLIKEAKHRLASMKSISLGMGRPQKTTKTT